MVSFSKSGSSLRIELESRILNLACCGTEPVAFPLYAVAQNQWPSHSVTLLPREYGERGHGLTRLDHLQVTKLQNPKFPIPETHNIETFQLKYIFLSFCFVTTLFVAKFWKLFFLPILKKIK